jgi:hypothetical protein
MGLREAGILLTQAVAAVAQAVLVLAVMVSRQELVVLDY